jgi:putative endonuclease
VIETDKRANGQAAELHALKYLQAQGMKLLAQNWSCRRGELDLVMLAGDTVVFVEVRYRKYAGWGGAAASVDVRKQQRIVLAAQHFLLSQPRLSNRPCRFDVVALSANGTLPPNLDWIANAFEA